MFPRSVIKRQSDFSKCDLVALTADLNLIDWSLIFSLADTINYAWQLFASKFSALIEKKILPLKLLNL